MRFVSVKYTTAAATASAMTYNTPALTLTFTTDTTQFAAGSNVAICGISLHAVMFMQTKSDSKDLSM